MAIPTLISRAAAGIYMLWKVTRPQQTLRLTRQGLRRLDGPMMGSILRIGVPSACENCFFSMGRLIVASMITLFGTSQVSANAVAGNIDRLGIIMGQAMGLAMVRILTGLHIFWLLIPGYLVSLVLTFLVPQMFTAIAFDSGGVASGPMTATFLLPLAIGACDALNGNILTDAFGLVAFVAMTPLVTIQLLGLISKIKGSKAAKKAVPAIVLSDEIVEFDIYGEESGVNE